MSRLTQGRTLALPVRDCHPLRSNFPEEFRLSCVRHWPGPRSLATTSGVSVDVLSSGYYDVSVPRVRLKPPILFRSSYLLLIPEIRNQMSGSRNSRFARQSLISDSWYRRWVAPFGNPRIKASSQLPTAYRSVARPSSPLSAKASTECP